MMMYMKDHIPDRSGRIILLQFFRILKLKMHTYNDAIRRTIGSYILYPGKGDSEDTKGNTMCIRIYTCFEGR